MGTRYCPVCLKAHEVDGAITLTPEEATLTQVLEFCSQHQPCHTN